MDISYNMNHIKHDITSNATKKHHFSNFIEIRICYLNKRCFLVASDSEPIKSSLLGKSANHQFVDLIFR